MPLIEITHLSKVFQSDKDETPTVALRDVDCTIEKGEFIAIIGPSGSGKSTLLQIIGLLDRPSSGSYRFNGKPVDDFTDDEQAALRNTSLGFIFQSFNLLARTSVLENVKLPLAYSSVPSKEWDKRALQYIEQVGLSHRTYYEPAKLSGGERQRVAIARALVMHPEIIFADEPTGNLDSASGKAIMDILEGLAHEGKTVMLITHDKTLAKRAKRIIRLVDGKITWDGKASDYNE
jgi:putative ABC transport system ATP-binding protein